MATSEAEYLEKRLNDQIEWFDRKSANAQKAYKRLRLVEIVAATSIPFLAGYSLQDDRIPILIGALGALVAILAGVMGLYRYQENWTEYRTVSEALKQEKFLFLARAVPYGEEEGRFETLVERVEAILHAESAAWSKAMRTQAEADRAARKKRQAAADAKSQRS